MLDGGISTLTFLAYFRSIGYMCNVAILTQPRDYVKKPPPPAVRMPAHRHKAIVYAMSRRHEMYNPQLRLVDEGIKRGDIICSSSAGPPISWPGRVSTNKAKMTFVYNFGRETAELHFAPPGLKVLGLDSHIEFSSRS